LLKIKGMIHIPHKMKSWQMDAIGQDQLELREVTVPKPGRGEILVKVEAIALNYRDKMVVDTGRGLSLNFPFSPGSDMAGTVVAAGEGASRFNIGDHVISTASPDWTDGLRPGSARAPFYRTLGGYYPGVLSEFVSFSEQWFVKSPSSLTSIEACTLPVAGLTAWFALAERAHVKAGDTVLIPSTGGVALFGLQIAKVHGAEVIMCGNERNAARAKEMGADHYIDRERDDWTERVLEVTEDRGVDVVLEVIGGNNLGRSVELAAVGGHICQIGALDGFNLFTPAMPLMLKDITIHGIGTGSRQGLENFIRAIDRTGLKPVIDTTYKFADLHQAFGQLSKGAFGKIVIELD
jgi:NADPH:quinone reductase-like Zn-dependent oxidoreductase